MFSFVQQPFQQLAVGYVNQLAQNVTTGYYRTEYVRVFSIGHKRKEKIFGWMKKAIISSFLEKHFWIDTEIIRS